MFLLALRVIIQLGVAHLIVPGSTESQLHT
jgi:hypothetical protein